MVTPIRTDLPSLRDVAAVGAEAGAMQDAARRASLVSVILFFVCFFAGILLVNRTGRTQFALAGTVGAFAVSALSYFGLRGRARAPGPLAAAFEARALGVYAPWLAEMRRTGLAPAAETLVALVRAVCALRAVRADYFVIADESLRFFTLSLWRIGVLCAQGGFGETAEGGLQARAEELAKSILAHGNANSSATGKGAHDPRRVMRISDDPDFVKLSDALVHMQTSLDRLEVLTLAALQLTHEARRLGRECELLIALPATQTAPLLADRIEREKVLQQTLDRLFTHFEK